MKVKDSNFKIKFVLIIALFSVCTSIQAQINWKRTKSEKSKISFELPEEPYLRNQNMNEISSEVFSYRDAANIYGLVASDFSKTNVNFDHSDPSEYYKQMKEGSLLSSDAILISEQSVVYHRLLGKEIVYTMLVGKLEFTYFKRFFFHGHFVYQITIGGPTRMKRVLLDKRKIFFDSVQFE